MDQLIQQARTSLLIATANIGLSREFQALLAVIAERSASDQPQHMQLASHPVQIAERPGSDPLAAIHHGFDSQAWPWPMQPRAYGDRRRSEGSRDGCVQRAKAVIVAANRSKPKALITSAT